MGGQGGPGGDEVSFVTSERTGEGWGDRTAGGSL